MCTALEGTNKPFLTTSGLLGVPKPPGGLAVEATPTAPWFPRRSESALDWAAKGVRAVAVRLAPSVHGTGDHGFVPRLADIARDKGCAAYVGDGANCWPGVHVADAAALYRLALERAPAGAVVHACADEGVPMKEVAALIGRKLGLPVAPVEGEAAAAHFGWFERFAAMDGAASSAATRDLLGWAPKGPGLLEDIEANYF